ncbi:MAG: DEAD/DEAH box helicase, partial [Proteobacteria bacterium]|nr:DEAD/DEAH box helicase [Pseudomonadota bacterium]
MVMLEDLEQGSLIRNLVHDQVVEIIQARQKGSSAVEITYKDAQGFVHQQIVLDFPSNALELVERSNNWSFDADADRFILTSEAYRIHLAHLFDPYVAVHTSLIEPLPHQITAVYQEMLTRQPLRYVLADDPGAGKTIMTGLLLKELMIRGDVKRCLIVTPGNLVEQWQDELLQKFNIKFTILTNEAFDAAASGNVFTEVDLALARLDKLSRNDDIQNKLKVTDWDLIVVDEAHKMSATVWGGDVKRTKRYDLGRLLSTITRNYLLLTATPHNGKEQDFQLFMSLIDADRFEGGHKRKSNGEVSDLLRRLVKEELLKFDGKPLFPERLATTVNYDLSIGEKELYSAVTEYVRTEFNRASNLSNKSRNTVGFALTVLQRRLASSPEAIYQSLKRRKEKLQGKLSELKTNRIPDGYELDEEDLYDLDDAPESELEEKEEELVNEVSAARTIEELDAEIQSLAVLEGMAQHLRAKGTDRKWDQLSKLLQDDQAMHDPAGTREKLIIFTEHRDTLRYLTDKVRSLLGRPEAVVNIYGGMAREKRREIEQLFRQDKDTTILIATDAAGEGINLQRAHLMINYDLPWN